MKEIDEAIQNLSKALKMHVEAQKDESVARDKVQKARHAVRLAREEVSSLTQQLLSDGLNLNYLNENTQTDK